MRVICTGFGWGTGRAEVGLKTSPSLTSGSLGAELRYCFDCGAELEVSLILFSLYVGVAWGTHPGHP